MMQNCPVGSRPHPARGVRVTTLVLLALVAWSACGKDQRGSPLPSDATGPPPGTDGTVSPPPDTHLPPPDTATPPDDTTAIECEPDADGFLPTFCPCNENAECVEGYCVPSGAGKVCTKICVVDCPDGWSCELITGFGGDNVFLCLPKPLQVHDYLMGDGFVLSSDNGQFFVTQSVGTPRVVGVTGNDSFTVTPGLPKGGK